MYFRCSGNNRAVTVMHAFMNAVTSYGVPEKVRSDLGGENVEVCSTHNEKIERLWRDVFRCMGTVL